MTLVSTTKVSECSVKSHSSILAVVLHMESIYIMETFKESQGIFSWKEIYGYVYIGMYVYVYMNIHIKIFRQVLFEISIELLSYTLQ